MGDQQNSAGVQNDVEYDQRLFDFIKKNDINIEELSGGDEEDDQDDGIPEQEVDEVDLSELSEEDYIDMMNNDITENKKLFIEEDEKEEKKLSDGVQYVRADKDAETDSDDSDDSDDEEGEDDEENDENSDAEFFAKNKIENNKDDKMEIDEESIKEDEKDLFENPLRKKKNLQRS